VISFLTPQRRFITYLLTQLTLIVTALSSIILPAIKLQPLISNCRRSVGATIKALYLGLGFFTGALFAQLYS